MQALGTASCEIKTSIVEQIIGGMFFRDDDVRIGSDSDNGEEVDDAAARR